MHQATCHAAPSPSNKTNTHNHESGCHCVILNSAIQTSGRQQTSHHVQTRGCLLHFLPSRCPPSKQCSASASTQKFQQPVPDMRQANTQHSVKSASYCQRLCGMHSTTQNAGLAQMQSTAMTLACGEHPTAAPARRRLHAQQQKHCCSHCRNGPAATILACARAANAEKRSRTGAACTTVGTAPCCVQGLRPGSGARPPLPQPAAAVAAPPAAPGPPYRQ